MGFESPENKSFEDLSSEEQEELMWLVLLDMATAEERMIVDKWRYLGGAEKIEERMKLVKAYLGELKFAYAKGELTDIENRYYEKLYLKTGSPMIDRQGRDELAFNKDLNQALKKQKEPATKKEDEEPEN